jgi:hypothetical protein
LLDFLDGRLGTWDGQAGGVQLAAVFDLGAAQAQHFDLGDRALGHQRLGHGDFLAQQLQAVGVLGALGAEFAQFLLRLDQLLLQAADFVLQLLASALVQRLFVGAWLGAALRSSSSIFSGCLRPRRSALTRRAMARREASVSPTLEAKGFRPGAAAAGQSRRSPFLGEDLRDDAALQVLDLLHLGRRNGLAFAARHFVDGRNAGPDDQEQEERDHAPDGQAHHARRILDQGLVDLGQRLAASESLPLK